MHPKPISLTTASAALAMALCALLTTGCVGNLDFDEIAPQCAAPEFDAPLRGEYCSGQIESQDSVAPPDDQIFIGSSSLGDTTLLVSGTIDQTINGAPFFSDVQFHTFSGNAFGDLPEVPGPNVVSTMLDIAFDDDPLIIPELLDTALLSERGPFSMLVSPDLLFISVPEDPFTLPFEMSLFRLSLKGQTVEKFIDAEVVELDDGRILALVASGQAGLKPFLYAPDGQNGWIEELPPAPEPLDLRQDEPFALLTDGITSCARNQVGDLAELCIFQCGACDRMGVECQLCRRRHNLTFAMESGAFSLDIENKRAYIGGLGALYVYETDQLNPERVLDITVEDGEQGTFITPRTDKMALPDFNGVRGDDMIAIDISAHDGLAYVAMVDGGVLLDEEPDDKAGRVYLMIVELNDGRFGEILSTTALPDALRTTAFADIIPLTEGLLAIKIVESELRASFIDDTGSPFAFANLSQEDVTLLIFDTIVPGDPRMVFETTLQNDGLNGLLGMTGNKGGTGFLFNGPEGIERFETAISGEALP